MNTTDNRLTVHVADDKEPSQWFDVNDAEYVWRVFNKENLYLVGGRFVLLKAEVLTFESGRVIDHAAALKWLTRNGFYPPDELSDLAEKHRIR